MSGAGVDHLAGTRFVHRHDDGHEHERRVVSLQDPVGLDQRLSWRAGPDGSALERSPARHHEQRRGDALVGHIRDGRVHSIVRHGDVVVEVAADVARRHHVGVDLVRRRLGEVAGQD